MKRYFSLFLLLAVILTGCGGKSKTQESETNILATAAQEMEEQTMPEQTSGIPFDQPVPVAQDNQDAGAYNHYDVIPGELTVTAYSDSETGFLKLAARKYEQSHPGTTIIIHEVGAQNGYSKSKYRDIVLTELMGGVSDDIVDVSPLSWVKLADSGKLLDLRQEIPLDSENYYLNVLDSYLYKGGRYCVPLSFNMFAYGVNESIAGTAATGNISLETLLALAEKYPDVDIFGDEIGSVHTPERVAFLLFSAGYPDYVDLENKTANVNTEKFISLLEGIQSIGSRINGDSPRPAVLRSNMIFNAAASALGIYDATGMVLLGDNGRSCFENVGFTPAVGANSPNKGLAIDFIQYLLSDEIQSMVEITSSPVNRNGVRQVAQMQLEDAVAAGRGNPSMDLERNLEIFDRLASNLTHTDSSDAVIEEFVVSEFEKFFSGRETAQQAAENLQSRLTLYLNE